MNIKLLLHRFRVQIEDLVLSAPLPGYKKKLFGDHVNLFQSLNELHAKGYTSIGKVISLQDLARLKEAIDEALQGQRSGMRVTWNDRVKYWQILNPLRLNSLLVFLAAHPLALTLAQHYFGRRAYLSDIDMRRVPPTNMVDLEMNGYSSSNWHRDTRGRQLKMMVYLSNVGNEDNNFALLPSTHRGAFRRKGEYLESRVKDEQASSMTLEPFEWYGQAGEAMLFDTNLVHRLRRKPSASTRDSITFYYNPGQSCWALDFDKDIILSLPDEARAIFDEPPWPFKRMHHK